MNRRARHMKRVRSRRRWEDLTPPGRPRSSRVEHEDVLVDLIREVELTWASLRAAGDAAGGRERP